MDHLHLRAIPYTHFYIFISSNTFFVYFGHFQMWEDALAQVQAKWSRQCKIAHDSYKKPEIIRKVSQLLLFNYFWGLHPSVNNLHSNES